VLESALRLRISRCATGFTAGPTSLIRSLWINVIVNINLRIFSPIILYIFGRAFPRIRLICAACVILLRTYQSRIPSQPEAATYHGFLSAGLLFALFFHRSDTVGANKAIPEA